MATVATVVATLIGVVVGLVAGFTRGWLDRVINFIIDVFLSLPVPPGARWPLAPIIVEPLRPSSPSSSCYCAVHLAARRC